MKQTAIIALFLFFSFSSHAQYVTDLEHYFVTDGMDIKKGDTLRLGMPDDNNVYQHIYEFASFSGRKKRITARDSVSYLVVKKIQKYGSDVNALYIMLQTESEKGALACELLQAIDAGEIEMFTSTKWKNKSRWPYISKDTLWLNETVYLREQDYVKLGRGAKPNGDFQFISIEYGLGGRFENRMIRINDFYKSGSAGTGYKYLAHLIGDTKTYRCDVENAILSGELVVPGMEAPAKAAAPSLADELLKLKELKDKGILTEDEFSRAKQKLIDGK